MIRFIKEETVEDNCLSTSSDLPLADECMQLYMLSTPTSEPQKGQFIRGVDMVYVSYSLPRHVLHRWRFRQDSTGGASSSLKTSIVLCRSGRSSSTISDVGIALFDSEVPSPRLVQNKDWWIRQERVQHRLRIQAM